MCTFVSYLVLLKNKTKKKLTLSQFFPLPSYALAPKERTRDATSPDEQKQTQPEEGDATPNLPSLVPYQRRDFFLCSGECNETFLSLKPRPSESGAAKLSELNHKAVSK